MELEPKVNKSLTPTEYKEGIKLQINGKDALNCKMRKGTYGDFKQYSLAVLDENGNEYELNFLVENQLNPLKDISQNNSADWEGCWIFAKGKENSKGFVNWVFEVIPTPRTQQEVVV